MALSLDHRRRRALYRAAHRGTRELDLLIGRFADHRVPAMAEAELAVFERLLAMPDPEIDFLIRNGGPGPDEQMAALFAQLRRFHGL